MELSQLEKQRTSLLQFLLLLIILSLGAITYIAYQRGDLYVIPSLTIASLLACLFVIAKERSLKDLHGKLVEEVLSRDLEVKDLSQELKGEHKHLENEKEKSGHLGIRLKEITDLYRAISTVNSVQEPSKTHDTVLRAALDLVECDCGSLMVIVEKGGQIVITASQGLSSQAQAEFNSKVGEGIAGWVAQHGEALLLTAESKNDERLKNIIPPGIEIRPSMSVPLQMRRKVIGIINFRLSKDAKREAFSEADLRIATIYAQHASVSIENSHLATTVQKLRESLQPT